MKFLFLFLLILTATQGQVDYTWEEYEIDSHLDTSDLYDESLAQPWEGEIPFLGQMAAIHRPSDTTEENTVSINPCHCRLKNDTAQITIYEGIYGDEAFNITIHKGLFTSDYFRRTEQIKTMSYTLGDSASWERMMFMPAMKQSLVLKRKPEYQYGEQVTGKLDFTSRKYYEGDSTFKYAVLPFNIRATFTCTLWRW